MLTVVDTRTCNIQSVLNAFRRVGAELRTTSDPAEVAEAEALVLPGVGAFGAAMNSMRALGLDEAVKRKAQSGAPLIGICLGMQMLAERSEEHGTHRGLGLIRGQVVRLQPSTAGCLVPNIGWYPCVGHSRSTLFPPEASGNSFYFVHSYHFVCDDPADLAATFDYGDQKIAAAVERGNIFGVQFHPEKSQDHGLDLLERFLNIVRARR